MKTCYVVMATRNSPNVIVIPSPRAVFMTRKEATEYCKTHNENPRTSTYLYVRKAELNEHRTDCD